MEPVTRRGLLVGAAASPLAVAVGAPILPVATPFRIAEARYWAASAHFNGLPSGMESARPDEYRREERAYLDAARAVDQAPVSSWAEFADAYEIACDGGDSLPNEDLIFKLLADVRRLKAGGLA